MVSREQIAKRLKRFEVLCGIAYKKEVADIWLEHFKDMNDEYFGRVCFKVEKDTKWHIQPTLFDVMKHNLGKWE